MEAKVPKGPKNRHKTSLEVKADGLFTFFFAAAAAAGTGKQAKENQQRSLVHFCK